MKHLKTHPLLESNEAGFLPTDPLKGMPEVVNMIKKVLTPNLMKQIDSWLLKSKKEEVLRLANLLNELYGTTSVPLAASNIERLAEHLDSEKADKAQVERRLDQLVKEIEYFQQTNSGFKTNESVIIMALHIISKWQLQLASLSLCFLMPLTLVIAYLLDFTPRMIDNLTSSFFAFAGIQLVLFTRLMELFGYDITKPTRRDLLKLPKTSDAYNTTDIYYDPKIDIRNKIKRRKDD